MSEQTQQNPPKRLPFGFTVDAEKIRLAIAQNLHRLESETDGDDYIPLWTASRLLGISDDDLVFLLVCRYVPDPELLEGGLFFYRSTFLSALQKGDGMESVWRRGTMNSLSRHERKYLEELRQRIGGNLYRLKNMSILRNATEIEETFVHGSPRTPHRRGGILDISANDFKFLVSVGVVSTAVRVEHSRGLYNLDMLLAELEHFTGYDDGKA